MKPCTCDEGRMLDGAVRRTIGWTAVPLELRIGWQRAHDCRYVAERNALIPEAEKRTYASAAHDSDEWSRLFAAAMDDLWRTRSMS